MRVQRSYVVRGVETYEQIYASIGSCNHGGG
jgi:hypothetical protein